MQSLKRGHLARMAAKGKRLGPAICLSTTAFCVLFFNGSPSVLAASAGSTFAAPTIPNNPPAVFTHNDIAPPAIHQTIPLPVHPGEPRTSLTPFLPTDLTQPIEGPEAQMPAENADVLSGLQELPLEKFPGLDSANIADGIIVAYRQGTEFSRPGNCSVELSNGDILVSVRRPSRLAQLTTKLADASFSPDADVEVRLEDGALRFINLSGLKERVLVKVPAGIIGDSPRVFAIRPGFEITIADHKLTRAELRPSDGYARRFHKRLENGQMAISEISVESILKNSDLVADLKRKDSGVKERRILADMSKMAAVLNYVNGNWGFESETKASLEVNSEIKNKN